MSGFKSKPKAEISEFARYKIRQIQIADLGTAAVFRSKIVTNSNISLVTRLEGK